MVFRQGHALLIGVDTYKHAHQLDVSIASQDAAAVRGVLADPKYCGYPLDQARIIRGEAATRTNILHALDQLAQRTKPEDTVFLFHCGHGDYGTDNNFYLICHDSQIEGNRVSSGTGISQQELLAKVKAIPARRLLLVFNACYSGEISPSLAPGQTLGGKNLPGETAEALLSTGSGRVIITACRENQKSWIGSGQLTIFTQALVDGLQGKDIAPRGGYISLFDLYIAVYETVSRKAKDLVGRQQEPELTILKGVGPIAVALYPGATETNLSVAEAVIEPPKGTAVSQIEPERSQQLYQQIISQTGGIIFGQHNRVKVSGDVTGGDRIDARESQGFIQHATGPVKQQFDNRINTGGGAYIGGNVSVQRGDFVGRDKVTYQPSSTQPVALEDFFSLLEQIRAELRESQLDRKVSSTVESEIASIQAEAKDDQPSLPIIETKLTSLKNLIEKASGVVVASTGLAKVIEQAIALAQKLFQ